MLANDGALVYSVDIDNMLIYRKGRVNGTIKARGREGGRPRREGVAEEGRGGRGGKGWPSGRGGKGRPVASGGGGCVENRTQGSPPGSDA